jgi:hypothetical protein
MYISRGLDSYGSKSKLKLIERKVFIVELGIPNYL